MESAIQNLLRMMDLEQLEVNLFRGNSPPYAWQRVFGGQVIGQALVAANHTVNGRIAHSLHGYFLRPGDPEVPIVYEVDRIRDGGTFTTRRVVGIQHGRAIFNMAASYSIIESGYEHQLSMPKVHGPEGLPDNNEIRRLLADKLPEKIRSSFLCCRPIEIRQVDSSNWMKPVKQEPFQNTWFRAIGKLPDHIALHQCVLAYASDMTLIDTALHPHGVTFLSSEIQTASLDHAIWFHRPFRADEWLLYTQDSPNASAARGFCRGNIFTQDGKLVASVAQEGLIRIRKK
jgi:acyl-CoA thioesterase II